jgi:hypothetical protein
MYFSLTNFWCSLLGNKTFTIKILKDTVELKLHRKLKSKVKNHIFLQKAEVKKIVSQLLLEGNLSAEIVRDF